MAIPNITFSTGMYFGDINGYSASSFEPAYQGSNAYYRRAMTRSSCIYFVTASGTKTDMYNLAYMPISASVKNGTDSATRTNTSYFNKNVSYNSGRVGDNFIKIKGNGLGEYPLSLALKGYRTMLSNSRTLTSVSGSANRVDSVVYQFFNTPVIQRANTDSSDLTIYLGTDYYTINDGSHRSWYAADGTTTHRYWVGAALQAGGGAGGDGWPGHSGGGGPAGGFWMGMLRLPVTITVTAYTALDDGADRGASGDITSNLVIVRGGRYAYSGGLVANTSPGGEVEYVSSSGTITYRKVTGGRGGSNDRGSGSSEGVDAYTLSSPTLDQPSMSFLTTSGGSKSASGGGGGSVMGRGGNGRGNEWWGEGYSGEDRGVDSKVNSYGAGGGGASGDGAKRTNGGSGGYPYIVIGY